ncbi:MAG: DinB family protein [Phycisphaerales bacterium]
MNAREHAIALLKFVRSISEGIVKDFPDEKFTTQNHAADNHPTWALGHLASTDGWIAGVLGIPGVKVPESYGTLFGQGSKPDRDAKKYPAPAELRQVWAETHAAVMKWFESAPESALQGDLKEKTGGFATDPIDLMFKIAWHEGWHMGQVATLRKALGLKPVMG